MKIISKYKDYYDYLSGIYGIDEKLILDRREKDDYMLPTLGKITIYIAGYIIEGMVKESGNIFYGDSLRSYIIEKPIWKWLSKHHKRDYTKSFDIKYKNHNEWYYLEPIKDLKNINEKHNCPILIDTPYGIKKYPMLSTLKLPSFLPAETIYQWLSEWLSTQITNKEKQIKELPNSLKIENKGFDKKKSFRPKMK